MLLSIDKTSLGSDLRHCMGSTDCWNKSRILGNKFHCLCEPPMQARLLPQLSLAGAPVQGEESQSTTFSKARPPAQDPHSWHCCGIQTELLEGSPYRPCSPQPAGAQWGRTGCDNQQCVLFLKWRRLTHICVYLRDNSLLLWWCFLTIFYASMYGTFFFHFFYEAFNKAFMASCLMAIHCATIYIQPGLYSLLWH